LWDIRSGQQIQVFNRHTNYVWSVEYSPFVIKNSIDNSNVICSGSDDNTIRFWDIRSNKNELFVMKGDDKEDDGIRCLKFIELKKKDKTMNKSNAILNLFTLIECTERYVLFYFVVKKKLKKLHLIFFK
ncbi:WD repeat-containing protein, partial [Reticulomyxa filosa]